MALLYVAVVCLLIWLVLQVIVLIQQVLTAMPAYYQDRMVPVLNNLWDLAGDLLENTPVGWTATMEMAQSNLLTGVQNLVLKISQRGVLLVTSMINATPSVFIALIFTVMLSFFISLQYDDVVRFISAQLSPKAADFLRQLRGIFSNTILRYMRAYVILMSITLPSFRRGLPSSGAGAVGLAAGIAVFDALPVFGTGGVMVPWAILELVQGNFVKAFQLFCSILASPLPATSSSLVVGDQLGINPIVSLVAIYLGFRLFGVLGMIACPMLAQILIALNQSGTIQLYRCPTKASPPPEEDTPTQSSPAGEGLPS